MPPGDARGVKPPEMDVSRAVDSDSMSEHLQSRRHRGATLSQRRSDFEDFRGFPCFQLVFERISVQKCSQ